MRNIFDGWLKRGVPDLSALDEAAKYLAFLQTYVCVDQVNTHHTPSIADLAQTPELPFDQHHREANQTSTQYSVQMLLDEELRSLDTDSVMLKPWVEPISAPGPEYINSSDEFFPVDVSVCPSLLFTGYQEKWARMARSPLSSAHALS